MRSLLKPFWRDTSWFVLSVVVGAFSLLLALLYSIFDLAFVIGLLGLLVLPGYLVSALIPKSEFTLPERLIVSIGLGMSLISLLGLGYSSLGVRIDLFTLSLTFVLIDGLTLALIGYKLRRQGTLLSFRAALSDWNAGHFLLLLILVASVGVRLVPVKGMIVPPYHDPAVHAILVELIVEQGTVPTSLQPYANIPMAYPPGLHILIAFFSILTGLGSGRLLLLVTNVFNGAIVLSAYLLFAKISGRQSIGLFSALFVGLISRFPAALYGAGKNSMVAGFLLLPIAMLLAYQSLLSDQYSSHQRLAYLIAAAISFFGLIVFYYTAAMLYLMFIVAFAIVKLVLFLARRDLHVTKKFIVGLFLILLVGAGLAVPYAYRAVLFYWNAAETWAREGYLARSPAWVTSSLTTTVSNLRVILTGQYGLPMVVFSFLGLLAVVLRRKAWSVALWFGVLVLFATPYPSLWLRIFQQLTGDIMLINLFLPLSFFSSVFIIELVDGLGRIQKIKPSRRHICYAIRTVKVSLLVVVVLWAAVSAYYVGARYYNMRDGALVKQTDYEALNWIRDNTPSNSTFLNNAYVWWEKQIILGSDAGSWIPAIAHRRVFFPVENLEDAWPEPALRKYSVLAAAARGPDNPEVVSLLMAYNISYVYIGPRTFPIGPALDPALFLESQFFRSVWHKDAVWIFELVPIREQRFNKELIWTSVLAGHGTTAYGTRDIQSGLTYLEFGKVEDGTDRLYLFMHPKQSGKVWWNFTIDVAPERASLVLIYGFRAGANASDGVIFSAFVNGLGILSANKAYTRRLSAFEFDLADYRGESVAVSLGVEPYGNNAWDWAIWVPYLSLNLTRGSSGNSALDQPAQAISISTCLAGASGLCVPSSPLTELHRAIQPDQVCVRRPLLGKPMSPHCDTPCGE